MSLRFSSIPPKRLVQGITSASTTFYVNNITSFDGITDVVPADLGTQHFCCFRNDTGSVVEFMEIDPSTLIAGGAITIVRRGLSYYGDLTTENADLKLDWPSNSQVQFGTDVPQIFQWLKKYIDDASIAGAVPASPSALGVVRLNKAADNTAIPYVVGANDVVSYAADSVGTDSYAITPSPAITAYAEGQIFRFKAGTANTGACSLNVNSLGVKTIKKDVSIDLSTGDILQNQIVTVIYDGTNMQLVSVMSGVKDATKLTGIIPIANLPTPAFRQQIPVPINELIMGSNQDGSVIYIASSSTYLNRYARDAKSGTFLLTHSINPTVSMGATTSQIIVIGNYIYIIYPNGTIKATRFLASDLTGEVNMTVPSVTSNVRSISWTDGIYAYVMSADSGTTVNKWSVSGTTFSAVSTGTIANITSDNSSSFFDGTNIYVTNGSTSGQFIVYKLADAMGSSMTTTTILIGAGTDFSSGFYGCFSASINNDLMYLGKVYEIFNATTNYRADIIISPITKP